MFGDDHPRFIEVSDLAAKTDAQGQRQRSRSEIEQRNRMNERYEMIFANNKDIFDGARVLDLASHDGRYSLAALKAGAVHVTGVEVRQSLVDKAQENLAFYDQDPETYRFVCGDVFEVLEREKFDVDVVLCLGFMYHTYRHTELMYRIHNLAPRHLIVDTMVTHDKKQTLRVIAEEDTGDIRSAEMDPWAVDRVCVLWPSVPALKLLVSSYGFEVESLADWKGHLAARPQMSGLRGYQSGARVTMRARSRAAAKAAGWEPVAPLPVEEDASPPPAESDGGWRQRVNTTLVKATGYELRRAPTKR